MNTFGDFLFELRKEKGMTQAELAEMLGVTNKAVSKWETGEAMPETGLLLPIARIFGVTVDELLDGKRAAEKEATAAEKEADNADEISGHKFTPGNDAYQDRTLSDKICGAVCAVVFMLGMAAWMFVYLQLHTLHPYWIIAVASALSCGIIGIIFDLCSRDKRERKIRRGENPYTGAACGIIMLTCIIAYLCVGAFTGLWHPSWVIVVCGVIVCAITGAIGGIFIHNKRDK